MKVLFLAPANSTHTNRWVNSLIEQGIEVHLVYCKDHKPQDEYKKNVIMHELPFSAPIGYYLNAPFLFSLQKNIGCDLMNAHYASGYGTLARLSNIHPLVLSVWGSDVYDFPYENSYKMRLIKKNLRCADYIASTSHMMAKQVQRICCDLKKPIAITPFGVDMDVFSFSNKESAPRNEIIIGTVKALDHKYGIDTLLEVFALTKKQIKIPIKLRIYGDGPQREFLVDKAKALNISEDVYWGGRIPNSEVPNALKNMDIFCCFSRLESFGVAAVEAMASGLPVIATQADGFVEVIPDGKAGFLCPIDDVNALSQKLKQFVLDENLRLQMGKMGRKHVEAVYNWQDNVSTMVDLYNHTIIKWQN